jgi:hypothetical protein
LKNIKKESDEEAIAGIRSVIPTVFQKKRKTAQSVNVQASFPINLDEEEKAFFESGCIRNP